jgi:hypothetical protein
MVLPMKQIEVRIRSHWRTVGVLFALYTAGFAAGIPFVQTVHRYSSPSDGLVDGLQGFMLGAVILAVGVVVSSRTGLGTPYIDAWLSGRPGVTPVKRVVSLSVIAVIAASVIVISLGLLLSMIMLAAGSDSSAVVSGPTTAVGDYPEIWKWFLVSCHAGVTEEILFRFGLMNLLAWIGRRLVSPGGQSLPRGVVWSANLIAALVFGAFHLVGVLPVPDVPLVQASVVAQNTMVGLVFGWFFWRFGLESAMLTHFFLDVFFYVIMIPVLMTGDFALILAWLVATVITLIIAISQALRSKPRQGSLWEAPDHVSRSATDRRST